MYKMNMIWLLLIIILLVLGGIGILAYKTLNNSLHSGCISAGKNSSGYTCTCETGMNKNDCKAKNGVWQSKSCGNSEEWDPICRTQILGSCVTSTGCAYPTLESECKSSAGNWKSGNQCSTPLAGPSQAGTNWT
jgi:hypothetical protein